jgi:cob(I)alamin adenosyltransferase
MGNRLTQIATRTGDDGTTGLSNNTRVSKTAARIAAMGDVDELNSHLGVLLCEAALPDAIRELLVHIQHDLFDLGGELSVPGFDLVTDSHLLRLDEALALYNATLPPLKEFILPGGNRMAAQAHVCRTVARRAERSVIAITDAHSKRNALPQYLNRLSDLLFVLARCLNRVVLDGKGGDDVYWKSRKLARDADAQS